MLKPSEYDVLCDDLVKLYDELDSGCEVFRADRRGADRPENF